MLRSSGPPQSFVLDNASTLVQRVYRGHLGRRKYKLRYDVVWAQKAEKWALVLQAGYRGMKGEHGHASVTAPCPVRHGKTFVVIPAADSCPVCAGRIMARAYYEKRHLETQEDASRQLQRVFRGYQVCRRAHAARPCARVACSMGSAHRRLHSQDKKLVAGMQKEVKRVNQTFFQTKGASESALFRKRNFLATDEDEVMLLLCDSIWALASRNLPSIFADLSSDTHASPAVDRPLQQPSEIAVLRNSTDARLPSLTLLFSNPPFPLSPIHSSHSPPCLPSTSAPFPHSPCLRAEIIIVKRQR